MGIIDNLKAESLRLRKERNPLAASITFAVSECEKIGKNNGNRQTTEDEAIKVVQKLIVSIEGNLALDIDDARKVALNNEKKILEGVLPTMVASDVIRQDLYDAFGSDSARTRGAAMKWAKSRWGALADMKTVGNIYVELWETPDA